MWGSTGMITATGSNLRSWSPSLARMDGLSTRMTPKRLALARLHAARKRALRKRSGGAAFGLGAQNFWVMRGLRPSGAPTKSSGGPRMTQKFRVLRRPHSLDAHHTHTHTPRDQQDRRRDHAQGPGCARRPADAHGRRHADTPHARPARCRLKPSTHSAVGGARRPASVFFTVLSRPLCPRNFSRRPVFAAGLRPASELNDCHLISSIRSPRLSPGTSDES